MLSRTVCSDRWVEDAEPSKGSLDATPQNAVGALGACGDVAARPKWRARQRRARAALELGSGYSVCVRGRFEPAGYSD